MLCKRKKTGKIYTIRCRRDHYPWTEQDILETLRDLGAPFLPHLRSLFRENGRVHLVLDHFPSGSLRDLVDRTGTLTSQRVMFYASEIIVGISNLHSIGVMHRNINPDDILFDQSGHVVISNFEFAEFVATSGLNTGAISYCWGFGMVLYFMFFGKHPFKIGAGPEGSEDLQARIIEGTLSPDSLRLIHPQTRDLILKCIERNPRIRLTLDYIKRHPFFANVSWAKVADRLVEGDISSYIWYSVKLTRELVPPLPGSFERHAGRDARSGMAYSPASPSSNPLGVIQLAPVQVQPLRIEKKASRSPITVPREAEESPFPRQPTEGGTGIQSPKPRAYKPLLSTDTNNGLPKDVHPVSGAEIWDILDQETQAATSPGTAQSGKRFLSLFKPKKSRNHRGVTTSASNSNNHRVSSIYPRNRLFSNFSTASFSWKKPRHSAGHGTGSTPNVAISYSRPESLDLPVGLEQIGSGIGFSYNLPPAIRSKASICSATPRSCHNIFGTRFTGTYTAATTTTVGVPATTIAADTTTGATATRALGPLAINGLAGPDSSGPFHQLFQTQAGAASGPGQLSPLFQGGDNDSDNNHNPRLPRSGLARSTPWIASTEQSPQTCSTMHLGTKTGPTMAMMTASSSPESDDGPFTPTAVACEEPCGGVGGAGDCSKEFDLSGGTLEGKMEPDLTLRLVTPPAFA
ncbi:hypothetical protein EST38_g11676 [Candolleomyces aberdarensis]|uniref:Protein kinase domain-containing protein n=1 Tax=Candolleomyces aberdarensis TaxID=2316362 RepID=A0A4Q2D495_9AGAR|nr:hypothetical protein EST38_g11676 [Candolleomyces aberdarensis]